MAGEYGIPIDLFQVRSTGISRFLYVAFKAILPIDNNSESLDFGRESRFHLLKLFKEAQRDWPRTVVLETVKIAQYLKYNRKCIVWLSHS